MDIDKIKARLLFLQESEQLKTVLRSGFTSSGRGESTAEHSWRLCLMAMIFADEFADMDMLKIIKMCIIHDLGEAIHGDVPAIEKHHHPEKSEQERHDLHALTQVLDEATRVDILELWQEYEDAVTPEAKTVKALDKLETILQHTQGQNPPDFDYAFNLTYGKAHTNATALLALMRQILDGKTRQRMMDKLETSDE